MNEAAEGSSWCADQHRAAPSSSQTCPPARSPLRSPCMIHLQMQSTPPRYYEELFCTSRTPAALVPLADAIVTSSRPQSDVVRQSYLGKLEQSHRRYYVLRAGSHTGPSRLEWYKNQEKFTAMEKSAGKAALFGSSKQGVIYLRCCLGVSRSGCSRKGHTVALYAKDQTMVLVAEDQREQEDWYQDIKKLMEEEQKDEEHGDGFDEEDDGYCTLPPAAFFKEVWPVRVKPRGLGCSKSLVGESRLCLTATSLILVRIATHSDLPSVTIPLLSVRRFGHLDGSFFLELGRTAPHGPGEIWMEAREQGNPAVAQQIHEVLRETIRALRALPDFSRSPTSNHNQLHSLLALKRRPKYRDKPPSVRNLPPRNPEMETASPTKCCAEPLKPHLRSHQSPAAETGSYMEMKTDQQIHREEPDEEQPLGYMMMSPQGSLGSSVLPQDDYMTMASPQKHDYSSPSSSPQTSFNSDGYSPLHPSRHHASDLWLLTSETAGQSERSIRCTTRPQEEQTSAMQRRPPAQTRATSSPIKCVNWSGTALSACGPGYSRPVQASPPSRAASYQSVRRYRLSSCLPSCLQAGSL